MTFISAGSRVAIAREAAFGQKNSNIGAGGSGGGALSQLGILNQDIDLPDVEREVLRYPNLGTGRKYAVVVEGKRDRRGTLPLVLHDAAIFYYIWGREWDGTTDNTVTTSGNTTPTIGATTGISVPTGGTGHTFVTTNEPNMPSFTLGVGLQRTSNNFLRSYVGTVVDGATFSLSEGRELNVSLDILSQNVRDDFVDNATLFSAFTAATSRPYLFYDRDSSISFMGRNTARVKDFTFSIGNNLQTHHLLGSRSEATTSASSSVTQYSINVTGSGNYTELAEGDYVRFGSSPDLYRVRDVSGTALTLTVPYQGGTDTGLATYYITADGASGTNLPNDPAFFTTSLPDFNLSMSVVPDGHKASESFYDILETGVPVDVTIPFFRSLTDRIRFVFTKCMLQAAPHVVRGSDGGAIEVTLASPPAEIAATVINTQSSAYNSV